MSQQSKIDELERLLNSEEDTPIQILPNGEIREIGSATAAVFKKIYLKKKGLTPEDYDRMMEAQDCKCAICGEAETAKHTYGYTFSLAVDHCHTTGKIRGLLCGRCNRGLGYFRDSTEILAKAIAYLRLTTAVPSPP